MIAAREDGRSSGGARRQRPVLRIVVIWLLTTAVIVALGAALSGVNVNSVDDAITAAAVIGLINALVWRHLRRWLVELGHSEYADDEESRAARDVAHQAA